MNTRVHLAPLFVPLLVAVGMVLLALTLSQISNAADRRETRSLKNQAALLNDLHSLSDQVTSARDTLDQLSSDNQMLREQLLAKGITPAVPVRIIRVAPAPRPTPRAQPAPTSPTTSPPTTVPPSTCTVTVPNQCVAAQACTRLCIDISH